MYKLSKKSPQTLEALQLFNSTRYHVNFDLVCFQRSYRRFYKFSILSSKLFYMCSKISSHSVCVVVLPNNRFLITYSFSDLTIEFTAFSNRELVEKLIKHNCI